MAVILVVDDHAAVAGAVAALLNLNGYDAETVHSGEAALESIRSRPVDLVVLDVMMPGMSGVDVLRALRADGKVPGLPVILFSAAEIGRHEARRLGAAGFVSKDDADGLLDLVAQHARATPNPT